MFTVETFRVYNLPENAQSNTDGNNVRPKNGRNSFLSRRGLGPPQRVDLRLQAGHFAVSLFSIVDAIAM
jgi:hypothetical protein